MVQVLVSPPNNVFKNNPQDYGIKGRGHWVTRSSRLQMVIDLYTLVLSGLLAAGSHTVTSRKNHAGSRIAHLIDQIC